MDVVKKSITVLALFACLIAVSVAMSSFRPHRIHPIHGAGSSS